MTTRIPGISPGQRIKYAREHREVNGQRAKLSQVEAAAMIGYSGDHWRKWESNDRTPSMAQWAAIAGVLGVTDLYDLTGIAHALAITDLPRHRTVQPILNAMIGLHPGEHVAPGQLAADVDVLWRIWQGNSTTRHATVGHDLPKLITSAEAAVRALDGDQRRDARATLASLYQLTGSYLRGVGEPALGVTVADRGVHAAEATDRLANLAAATWWQAAILSSARHTDAALALCYQLIGKLEPMIATAPRELIAVFGQTHLLASVQAVRLRQTRRAYDLLAGADRAAAVTAETNDFHTAFGPINVLMHRGTAATEGCRYPEAVLIGGQIDTARSPSVERRVAHRVNYAHALVAAKDTYGGLTVLAAACDDDTAEVRSLVLARETARQIQDRRTPAIASQVDALLERLQLAA